MDENRTEITKASADANAKKDKPSNSATSPKPVTAAAKAGSSGSKPPTTKKPGTKPITNKNKAVSSSSTSADVSQMKVELGKLAQAMETQKNEQTAFQNMLMTMFGAEQQQDIDDVRSVTSDLSVDTDASGLSKFINKNDHPISDEEEYQASASTDHADMNMMNEQQQSVVMNDKSNTTASASASIEPEGQEAMKIDIGFAQRFAVPLEEGEPIRPKTAKALECLMVSTMSEEARNKAYDKHIKPKNCATLLVPKVNPPIWENLSTTTRSRDVKIQGVMKPMVKGLIAIAKTPKPTMEQEEGLALVAHAFYEMNNLRKDLIKPELNKRYVHLCKPTVRPTEWLFGDQLSKTVKDLDEEQKAVGVMRGRTSYNFKKKFYNHNSAPYRVDGWQSRRGGKSVASTFPNPFLGGKNYYQQMMKSGQMSQNQQQRQRFQNHKSRQNHEGTQHKKQ